MSILPNFPEEKELDLENTFICIDDVKEKITWKIPISRLIQTIRADEALYEEYILFRNTEIVCYFCNNKIKRKDGLNHTAGKCIK